MMNVPASPEIDSTIRVLCAPQQQQAMEDSTPRHILTASECRAGHQHRHHQRGRYDMIDRYDTTDMIEADMILYHRYVTIDPTVATVITVITNHLDGRLCAAA